MATQPRVGSYLNLEKVRVSEDPKNNTIHITSKDPDIPGGFHVSLNSGTQTEKKLRRLLKEFGSKESYSVPNTMIPNYAAFHQSQNSVNKALGVLRSLSTTPEPEDILSGDPMIIPLGSAKYSDGIEEKAWNIAATPNLVCLEESIIGLIKNHVEYWDEQWSFCDLSSFTFSGGLKNEVPGKAKSNFDQIILTAQYQAELLREFGVSHIDDLDGTDNAIKRVMILGKSELYNGLGEQLHDPNSFQMMFGSLEHMELTLSEFSRLGIHFAFNLFETLKFMQQHPTKSRFLAPGIFKHTVFARSNFYDTDSKSGFSAMPAEFDEYAPFGDHILMNRPYIL